eukprot:g2299.t1
MRRFLASGAVSSWLRDTISIRLLSTTKPRNDYLENLFDLTGSVAFVTGGSGGIGWQTCLSLAKAGADVMVTDYSEDTHKRCDPLVNEIRNLGRQASSCVCDVRYPESVKRAVNKCKDKLGLLDILVANAGILGGMQIPEELDDDNWKNVFATNVDGVFHCCRAAYPIMKNNGRGKVIIMSSVSSLTGYHTHAAFSSSKGAVIPFAKSLAVAWAPANIQVNCVLPGAVNTEFNASLIVS